MKQSIILIAFACFIISCGEDQLDFVGSYEMISLRQECTDNSQNAEVRTGEDGICLVNGDGFNCISGSVVILEGGTYEFTIQRTDLLGGIRLSRAPEVETGTYEIIDDVITLDPSSSSPTTMRLDPTETFLDWVVATTADGCERIYRYQKTF